MGIEYHNGFPYYYEKRRDGDRVSSVYSGSGMNALIQEQIAQAEKQAEAAKRLIFEQERREIEAIDKKLDAVLQGVFMLAESALVASGYYKHKRQWRKRGNG